MDDAEVKIKNVCVFCGSSPGSKPDYLRAAEELGKEIAFRKMSLIYGGASVGLMGMVARTVLEAGGRVVGVIPESLKDQEIAQEGLLEMYIVSSMHERKAKMAEFSDAFIALPGGFGTFEEFFEMITWAQLGIHDKPCGLLNISGYYDKLLSFLDDAVTEGFIYGLHRDMILTANKPSQLIEKLQSYKPVRHNKIQWVRHMENGDLDKRK